MNRNFNNLMMLGVVGVATLFATSSANSQPTYSIDAQSASVGITDPGAILTPQPPVQFPSPAVAIASLMLGIQPNSNGLVGELDALSYGTEPYLLNTPGVQHYWTFSVDEFAAGRPGVPGPSVTTEGVNTTLISGPEAAGDIYASTQAPGPFLPYAGVNTGLFDGNGGLTPFAAPGLNLREPANPTVGQIDAGDNLDAWDLDQSPPPGVFGTVWLTPVYFSLDSQYQDPLEAPQPFNTGTAVANGFVGGDVLVTTNPGGPPALFASAASLGLDQLGPDHDDLDALVLAENGDGVYNAPTAPYSWTGGATDMLLFSVRRGSAIIGQPDSLLGLPIEEGDILMPATVPGGLPGIFVPAEALGLLTKRTNGTILPFQFADELDALDVQQIPVPEPTACLLLVCGIGTGLMQRRRS
jgi:hypothetical protein